MTHPTPHALGIPEILSAIFGLADPTVNIVSTQVCKLWSNLALDVLWKEVDNLSQLLSLLGPLTETTNGPCGEYVRGRIYLFSKLQDLSRLQELERPPSENDWKRFEKYATRVRRLKYQKYNNYLTLSDDAFEILEQSRRQREILPNLQTLECNSPMELRSIRIFMHSRVKKLVIYLHLNALHGLQVFSQDVITRMPNLAILDIRSDIPVRNIEEDLAYLLQRLPRIQEITFPNFYFTTKIAESLSRAEHLSSIDFHDFDEVYAGDSLDVAVFNPTFTEGAFPSLSWLSIFVNFDDAARFVKTPFSPNKLTHFRNDSYSFIDTPDSAHQLLSALSENYQLLKELELTSKLDASITNLTDKPSGYITLDTLKPIFKLPHLVVFELQHQYPLLMTQQDIAFLASSCPTLEMLRLGIDSAYLNESTLTLAALIPLAQHCPNLVDLGLFMDATVARVPEISLIAAPKPFKSLRFLCVGCSIIDESLTPATYLSQLLSPDCVIETGPLWEDGYMSREIRAVKVIRDRLWDKVKGLVPVLNKVRAQDRRRMRGIVEDLRVSVAMLQDPVAIGTRLELLSAALA